MALNPFEEKSAPLEDAFRNWRDLDEKAIRLTACEWERVLLAVLTEREAASFQPEPASPGLRRELSVLRRCSFFELVRLSALLPDRSSPVEDAVRAERMEMKLTAAFRALSGAKGIGTALDFSLPEEADHLYRFSNLLMIERDAAAEHLLDGRGEITPGRPGVSAHRHPRDAVFPPLSFRGASRIACLAAVLMSGVQRQLSAFYARESGGCASREARVLFAEAAILEEQHATQYMSLTDPGLSAPESLLWRCYAQGYLYYSLEACETNARLKEIWRETLAEKTAQLAFASGLLKRFGQIGAEQLIEDGEYPPPLVLSDPDDLARGVLARQATLTMLEDSLIPAEQLPPGHAYFSYQQKLNGDGRDTPSHRVIEAVIGRYGTDYRFESRINPLEALQNRRTDNTSLGRTEPGLAHTR